MTHPLTKKDRAAFKEIAEAALDIANDVLVDEAPADRSQNRGHIVGALIQVMGQAYLAKEDGRR